MGVNPSTGISFAHFPRGLPLKRGSPPFSSVPREIMVSLYVAVPRNSEEFAWIAGHPPP